MRVLSAVRLGLAVGCLMVATGCADTEAPAPVAAEPEIAISCIAVMPARAVIDSETVTSLADEKSLAEGRLVLNSLLRQQLTDKVRFVPEDQAAAKGPQVAARLKCNAVLETTLSRYRERVGSQYGVQDSAAVTFAYKLTDANSGRVLCHGRFDEKQQPVMDNLLKSRGLSWLTAEELMRDGLRERLGQCVYLDGK